MEDRVRPPSRVTAYSVSSQDGIDQQKWLGKSLLLFRLLMTAFCLSCLGLGINGIYLGGSGVQAANSAYPDYASLDEDMLTEYNSRLRMLSYGWSALGCILVINALLNVIAAWRCNERLVGFAFGLYVLAFGMAIVTIVIFEVRLSAQDAQKDQVDTAWEMLANAPQSSVTMLAVISIMAAFGVGLNVGLIYVGRSYKVVEEERESEMDEVFSARTDSVRSRC